MLRGINHITLSVSNLEKSVDFYARVLGCKQLAMWDTGAYLMAGNLWLCLMLDTKARQTPLPEYTHIAFDVSEADFLHLKERIHQFSATLWKDNTSEGNSLYFLDPNGHKLEIHTTSVHDRLAACRDTPYAGMVFFDEKEPA